MNTPAFRLEHVIGVVLRGGVAASSLFLAVGLGLSFLPSPPAIASTLLQAGVVVLLCTPVARVVISIVEYVRERDWPFVALTLIVLAEVMASAVAALVFNRRL